MSGFWSGKRVLVVGGSGFIGSCVVERLLEYGAQVSTTASSEATLSRNLGRLPSRVEAFVGDLTVADHARHALKDQEVVIYMAARVGGVAHNIRHPASLFRDNMQPFLSVIEAARCEATPRFVITSSACVYPRDASIPTPESEGFVGIPEQTNSGYGWAKRMEEFVGEAYQQEFGLNVAIARPVNAYGPRDNFDPATSHAIPSLIRRTLAGENPLDVWGDGQATRTFLYVSDFAEGVLSVAERSPQTHAINLASDEEVTIRELAELIVELSGCRVQLRFDPTKPSGQPRRRCDTQLAKTLLGFTPKVSLDQGLRQTIDWYRASTT